MSAARPRFLFGPPSTGSIKQPMVTVTGLSLAEAIGQRERGFLSAQPLLHQEKTWIDDRTPAAATRVEMRLGINKESQGDVHRAVDDLWTTIGTNKGHLWLVDDDQYETITTSSVESAGSNVVVEYTAPAVTWFAVNDYLFIPDTGGSSGNEVVVVEAKTDATPSFTADLAKPHLSGAVCYKVEIVYPNAVLQSIRPSATPIGKGSLVLTFVVQDVPLKGTTLPT